MTKSIHAVLLIALSAALLAGCNKEPGLGPTGKVAGTVTLDGAPVSAAKVVFETPTPGFTRAVDVNADGTYEVKAMDGVGLPVGTYNVSFAEPSFEAPKLATDKVVKPDFLVPQKYRSPKTSELKIDVKEGDNPPFDFKLTK